LYLRGWYPAKDGVTVIGSRLKGGETRSLGVIGLVVVALVYAGNAAAAGDRAHTGSLLVKIARDRGATGPARVQLRREVGKKLVPATSRVARGSTARFSKLRPGTYAATLTASGSIGGISFVRVPARAKAVTVRMRLKHSAADTSRAVSKTFTPGQPLVLQTTDALGISYELYLPPDALAATTTITLAPLSTAIGPGASNGTGFELSPDGLQLADPGSLTITGGTTRARLVSYNPATALWIPAPADGRTYEIQHFSNWDEITEEDQILAQARYAKETEAFEALLEIAEMAEFFGKRDIANGYLNAIRGRMQEILQDAVRTTCKDNPDLGQLVYLKLVFDGALRLGIISPDDVAGLFAPIYRRCLEQARRVGNNACRVAEQRQNGPARADARKIYLIRARALAFAGGYADLVQLLSDDIQRCTGYDVDAVYHFAPLDEDYVMVHAFTCDETILDSHWHGQSDLVPEGSGPLDFVIVDGSRFEWAPEWEWDIQSGDDEAVLTVQNWGRIADIPNSITFHVEIVQSSNPSFIGTNDNPVTTEIKFGINGVPDQNCVPTG
jgi:hypothetical protein